MLKSHHPINFQYDRFTRACIGSRISIITPADNSSYTAPANFSIAVNASDSDGSITKVDFYNGATLLSTVTTAPYAISLANANNAGNYTLTATATQILNISFGPMLITQIWLLKKQ